MDMTNDIAEFLTGVSIDSLSYETMDLAADAGLNLTVYTAEAR